MAENTRQYIFSERLTRLMFIGSGILMVSTVLGILLLASSRPRGEFIELEREAYISTLETAAQSLEGYGQNEDGSYHIPIERAMELVVERGVANPFGQ